MTAAIGSQAGLRHGARRVSNTHRTLLNCIRPSNGRGSGTVKPRSRNVRSKCRCSNCTAIRISSRVWPRSSSTREPSDPPFVVVIFVFIFAKRNQLCFCKYNPQGLEFNRGGPPLPKQRPNRSSLMLAPRKELLAAPRAHSPASFTRLANARATATVATPTLLRATSRFKLRSVFTPVFSFIFIFYPSPTTVQKDRHNRNGRRPRQRKNR